VVLHSAIVILPKMSLDVEAFFGKRAYKTCNAAKIVQIRSLVIGK